MTPFQEDERLWRFYFGDVDASERLEIETELFSSTERLGAFLRMKRSFDGATSAALAPSRVPSEAAAKRLRQAVRAEFGIADRTNVRTPRRRFIRYSAALAASLMLAFGTLWQIETSGNRARPHLVSLTSSPNARSGTSIDAARNAAENLNVL